MTQLIIETKSLPNTQIKILAIHNALGAKEVPKEYFEHVPYMLWRGDDDHKYLLVNYIGGIEDIHIGDKYDDDKWNYLIQHIRNCEMKLHRIKRGMTMHCPFCNKPSFNKETLKQHLLNDCGIFAQY